MRTELGFELTGKFTMPADEPPGLEGGHVISVYLDGHESPIRAVVTKVVAIDDGRRQITFCTPAVVRIEPPPAGG
jgi:hypothetical protein